MLQRMNRIQIIGSRKDFDSVVDVLYNTGTVHLEDVTEHIKKDELPLERVQISQSAEVTGLLEQISVILTTLPVTSILSKKQDAYTKQYSGQFHKEVTEQAKKLIEELETTTKDLAVRKGELSQRITALNRYAKILHIIEIGRAHV